MRSAFFHVVANYPHEAIKTFTVDKAKFILGTHSAAAGLKLPQPPYVSVVISAAIVQLALLLSLFLIVGRNLKAGLLSSTPMLAIFAGTSVLPLLAAWSLLSTSMELIFFEAALILALVLWAVSSMAGWALGLGRGPEALPRLLAR